MHQKVKFNSILQKYKHHIYNYAFYMMRNRMDAEDVTQEVIIKLWQQMGNFSYSSSKAWLMRTTHNLCIDHLRKRSRNLKREQEFDEEVYENIKSDDGQMNPEQKISSSLMIEKIKDRIEELPERLKAPFVLYQLQGFKYKEISKILDVPLSTVKVNILRARKRLQQELLQYEPEKV